MCILLALTNVVIVFYHYLLLLAGQLSTQIENPGQSSTWAYEGQLWTQGFVHLLGWRKKLGNISSKTSYIVFTLYWCTINDIWYYTTHSSTFLSSI